MKRFSGILLAALALAPAAARADYLYDAFRAECTAQADHYYSAADPVVATVPQEETEIGRIGNNFLVYGGFQFGKDGNGRIVADDLRGHLYGIRLFREKQARSNEWEFTDTSRVDLLTRCGLKGSACLFDAGQMLQDRTEPRRIFTGMPGQPIRTTSDGDLTIPFPDTKESPALREISTSSVTELRKVWSAWVRLGIGDSTPFPLTRNGWQEWIAGAPIASALPQPQWEWDCVQNCGKKQTAIYGWLWKGWDCPDSVPNSLCREDGSVFDFPDLWSPDDAQLEKMSQWLHGRGRHRPWRLGDIYHASAAVVEPPAYEYKDRFYPEFRKRLKDRPVMIYVGANDGMIHAFHASPDFERPHGVPRWQVGEEAWAYLPVNMLARTLVATETGEKRFFSQDLSCRFTDVQVDRSYRTTCDHERDPFCGWRTVLLCGQGWGGSWYVALDVTDPLAPYESRGEGFAPLWEFTHLEVGGNQHGLGRTWSVPAIGLIALYDPATKRKEPTWVSVFGNGYNSAMREADGGTRLAYRTLNLPFDDSPYPEDGAGTAYDVGHAYVLDTATGKLLKSFHQGTSGNPFVADGTILDFDDDGLVDAAYLGAYRGMYRVGLANRVGDMSLCELSFNDDPGKGPITGHPTAFAYRVEPDATEHPVVLVVGAGMDVGNKPDEQQNNGNNWDIAANVYFETDAKSCPDAIGYGCDLAFDFNDGSHKARLLGAPLFTRQTGGEDWLVYSVWVAPHHNKICGNGDQAVGDAHLFCMDVTLVARNPEKPEIKTPCCRACRGFGKNDNAACGTTTIDKNKTLLYDDVIQPPSSPVAADGKIYVTSPDNGFTSKAISDRLGNDPTPNTERPQSSIPARLISWREVYEP